MLYNLLISYNLIGSIEDFIDSFEINVHWRLYDLQTIVTYFGGTYRFWKILLR
jgi:hypothetical protein